MGMQTKTIGRMPTDHGPYDPQLAYGKKFTVTLFDCGWESKHDNNTSAPATLNAQAGTITENTTDWKKVWGSYKQWLIDNGYQKMDASDVKDGNNTQHDINAAFANEIGSDSTPESIKGRITNLEGAVGTGGSVDERIAAEGERHYLKSETYTKEEVNGMITTPEQGFVSVSANSETTAATDVLPATGEADTIYRVANWDGSQYDTSVYSEYSWNTSTNTYIKLSTKQVGIDDEPTEGSNNLVKSGGVLESINNIGKEALIPALMEPTNTENGYLKDDGSVVESAFNDVVKTYNVSGIHYVFITGRQGGNSPYAIACVYDYGSTLIKAYVLDYAENYNNYLISLPNGASTIKVCSSNIDLQPRCNCSEAVHVDYPYLCEKSSAIEIQANTNLNTITKRGLYFFTRDNSETLTNIPHIGGGYLKVENASPTDPNYFKQSILYGDGTMYSRECTGLGAFGKWIKTFGIITPLEGGDDLNDISERGKYSFTRDVSETLVHLPKVGGGFLTVMDSSPTDPNYFRQELLYGDGSTYYRVQKGIGSFTGWVETNITYVPLSSGADLNSLEYGLYSFDIAVSSTLLHAPKSSGGGVIKVEKTTPSISQNLLYSKQTVYYGSGETYYRYCYDGAPFNNFTEWIRERNVDYNYDGVNIQIPNYWESEIDTSINSVLQNRLTIGKNIAEFFFITDTHYLENVKKSPALIANLQKALSIEDVIFGGDAIDISQSTKLLGLKELQGFVSQFNFTNRLLFTLGNHDRNAYVSSSATLTSEELYATITKQLETYGDTNGKSISVNFFDNEVQKIRFINFNYELTDAQQVIDVIKDLPSDWTVLLFTHEYWEPHEGSTPPTVISSRRTMMNNIIGGTFSCTIAAFIVGHVHSDQNDLLDNNIPVIGTTTDCLPRNIYGGPTMIMGTSTEQAFDIVQIDTYNRKLYFTRVGAGSDRKFSY